MIIFNVVALVEVFIGAAIGGIVGGVMHLLGFDFTFWFVVVSFLAAAPLDGLWRLGQSFGEEEGASPLNLVMPGGGGHLFFLPVWLVGTGVAIAAMVWG